MKVVKVLWVGSCNSNKNWTVAEDIEIEPMYIDSFGVVVKDTDEFLAIAQNYGDDPEQYSNITTIPKNCIKEVFVIHEDNVCENEQKPAEWSEEDEQYLLVCKNALRKYQVTDKWDSNIISQWLDNKLKCLRPRQWKPSEEQMKALEQLEEMHVLGCEKTKENAHLYVVIKSLKEQLKQL